MGNDQSEKAGTDIRSNDDTGIERRDVLLGGGALLALSGVTGGTLVTSAPVAAAQTATKMKITTDIPASITLRRSGPGSIRPGEWAKSSW